MANPRDRSGSSARLEDVEIEYRHRSRRKAMSQAATDATQAPAPIVLPEVLTLTEAAEYLRVSESDVLDLATKHELPGRKIGQQWRFHRQGLAEWLLRRSAKERLLRHAGAMKDDPDMESMLDQIYRDRGRPMTENKE
jgi:excisionase family DNA binding protein